MRRFILGWKVLGHEQRFQAKIVNYADDFVICCRRNADEAMEAMRSIMRKLKLTVNEEKTHLCRIPDESFDFLGYTFGRCYSDQTGRRYIGTRRLKEDSGDCRQISRMTGGEWLARRGDHGESTQPDDGGLGALLLPGPSQASPSQRELSCREPAPSVVVSEAQSTRTSGHLTLP